MTFRWKIYTNTRKMEYNGRNKKNFYVVRFIELPFEGIDRYVCVPNSWVIIRRVTDKKVVVAYPSDEDPFDTRDRAQRNERYSEGWAFYMAEIVYGSDTYKGDECLTASRNGYGPVVDKDSGIEDSQPLESKRDKPQLTVKFNENSRKPLQEMLLKRTAESKSTNQHDKRQKLDNAAQASGSTGNYINMGPECSKRERSTVIGERDQTEAAAASSSHKSTLSQIISEKRQQASPVRQVEKQQPSLPIIDVDGPTEVISIDEEDHLQGERQPSEANSNIHDHQRHSQGGKNSYSNFQPIISEVRSIREADTNQAPRIDRISSNEPYASHHLPSSLKMSALLYSQMNDKPSLIPMHEPVEMRIRLANSERLMAIAARNPSTLMDQRRPSSPARQEPTVTQNSMQNIPQFRIKIGTSSDMNALDPKIVLERIDNVASGTQHTPSLPHQRPSFVRLVRKRRTSLPLEQRQQQPVDVPDALQRPSGSHNIAQRTSLKEFLMHEASSVQRLPNPAADQPNAGAWQSYQHNPGNFPQEQRQELCTTSTQGIHPAQPTRSGLQIGAPARHLISTNIASKAVQCSDFSQQNQLPQYHQDSKLQPGSSKVGIRFKAKRKRKSASLRGVARRTASPVLPNIPNSIGQALPAFGLKYLQHLQRLDAKLQERSPAHERPSEAIDDGRPHEHVDDEPFSMYREITSDSDHEANSDHETSTDEAPVEVRNNADATRRSVENNQHQSQSRLALEQQMVDQFSTIFTQMGSTLYYSCEMFKNLRSSILESADTYKKLMEIGERFNALGPSASAASSKDAAPKTLQVTEERQTKVTGREDFNNYHQRSNAIVDGVPEQRRNLRKIVLPAEYDPNDTKWTLKYQKIVPGLAELVPESGIYVNSKELRYSERVSNNCKTLVQLVLLEVFSKAALSVCFSLNKKPSVSDKARPPLDQHAAAVLLNYVLKCGLDQGWDVNTQEILKAVDSKMREFRNLYGRVV